MGDRLAVPLQLSGFRNEGSLRSLRKAQAQLPTDVADYLARHRAGVDDDVLTSPEYCLQIFFLPIAANRERSADAVVRFVPPDKVTPELEKQLSKTGVVAKRRITPVASADLLRPDGGGESCGRTIAIPLYDGHPHTMLEALRGTASDRFRRTRGNQRALLPMGSALEGLRLYEGLGREARAGPERRRPIRVCRRLCARSAVAG